MTLQAKQISLFLAFVFFTSFLLPYFTTAQTAPDTSTTTAESRRQLEELERQKQSTHNAQYSYIMTELGRLRGILPQSDIENLQRLYGLNFLVAIGATTTAPNGSTAAFFGPTALPSKVGIHGISSSPLPQVASIQYEIMPPLPSDLRPGDRGESVRLLQEVLNWNPATLVAEQGPGSPGNETDFFGPATKRAVIAFQNMHAKEVLLPAGLSVGTGFVGPLTRNKLNEILLAH